MRLSADKSEPEKVALDADAFGPFTGIAVYCARVGRKENLDVKNGSRLVCATETGLRAVRVHVRMCNYACATYIVLNCVGANMD